MSARRRWPDLPPELLACVSGRLHDAADYVRFHAICKPWRESLPSSAALRPFHFPWLLSPPSSRRSLDLDMKLRCVFCKTSYRAEVPVRFFGYSWVARADGTAAWLFSAFPEPKLVDPLTGDVTALPPFVRDDGETGWEMENSQGVVYGDGTLFLYNFSQRVYNQNDNDDGEKTEEGIDEASIIFRAAILRPGDDTWKFVDKWFDRETEDKEFVSKHFFAAYRVYDGKILLHMDAAHHVGIWHHLPPAWHLLLPPTVGDHASVESEDSQMRKRITSKELIEDSEIGSDDVFDFEGGDEDEGGMTWNIPESEHFTTDSYLESSHVLESRGELLRVSVLIQDFIRQPMAYEVSPPLEVLVHALEEEVDANGRHMVRWVRRHGESFADRVMFLGFPTSFAVEASRFRGGVDGGSVYFLQRQPEVYRQSVPGVFRYSLVDEKAKFMERLPLELVDLKNKTFMWLMPQPGIAPIQVIRERMESPKTGGPTLKFSIRLMEKPPKTFQGAFSFNVQNLPPGVDSSWLRGIFNKYGEVSNAVVNSLGKGCATMAMATSYKPYDVVDALDGLVLDGGYTLKVSEAAITTGDLGVFLCGLVTTM